ncbi:MAG: PDZ domain-containing protein [Lachnospiraceae bacterium]|nr:PDZ domain-containing protein [Lachnospiraceae bacterium]
METPNEKGQHSFIHERIVPKKTAKKVIVTLLVTIGLAVLFGGVASVTFFLSQNSLSKYNPTDAPAPSLFIRDDIDAPTEERPSQEDVLSPVSTEESESEVPDGSEEETVIETEPEPVTVTSLYNALRRSFVQIVLKEREGEGLLGTEVARRQETFGIAVAETEENMYFLIDATHVTKDAEVEFVTGSAVYKTTLFGRDQLTGLGVAEIPKSVMDQPFTVVELGNSSVLQEDYRVFMIGTPFGQFLSKEEGRIVFSGNEEGFWDGSRQCYYTNMQRIPGAAASLFSEEGKLVGWISDYAAGDSSMAVASGISPLKYLIEDLCLGVRTAYMGVRLRSVNWAEAAANGIQKGIYVAEIEPGSPAYLGGIQPGDRLQSIDGRAVVAARSVQNALDNVRSGDSIRVVVMRRTGDSEEPVSLLVNTSARKS